MQSRRDFIKRAGILAGAGASNVVPASVLRAFAIEPEPGSTFLDAEHIVVLMQENRSFDHTLGTLQGVRGFNDPRAIRQANGNSVFVQTNATGESYAPWRLDIRNTKVTWMGSIPHARHTQVDAWNEGHHDAWLDAKRPGNEKYRDIPLTMGHYTREDLPFYYALADAFTVMDQHYCGVMSSTTPNRCLFWTGTIRDEQKSDSRVFIRNEEIDVGNMSWGTWAERLQDNGISWKFYQNELTSATGMSKEERAWLANFGCNVLEFFANYNVGAIEGGAARMQQKLAAMRAELKACQAQRQAEGGNAAQAQTLDAKIELLGIHIAALEKAINRSAGGVAKLDAKSQELHRRALVRNTGDPKYRALSPMHYKDASGADAAINIPAGDILHQFREDVNNGRLPMVSYLAPPEKFSDHPTSPWYGAWFVSEIFDILTKNPEVWKKTIFILTYDENDGYFDHAPSFVAADPADPSTGKASSGIDTALDYTYAADEIRQGVDASEARTGPIGMGFRVPMIIASPWTRGGWVNSQLCDHTSNIQFMEQFFEKKLGKTMHEPNVSAWRRAVSGNLLSAFRPADAPQSRVEPVDRNRFIEQIQQAKNKKVPTNFVKLSAAQIDEINRGIRDHDYVASQEKGIRPSNPLPYELYADGRLNADGTAFELRLKAGSEVHGAQSAGSPFNVYLRNVRAKSRAKKVNPAQADMLVATYAVKAGDAMPVSIPLSLFQDGLYEIDVHGPNGFYRSFIGDKNDPVMDVLVNYESRGGDLTGNAQVYLANPADTTRTVRIADNSYKTGAQQKTLSAGGKQLVLVNSAQSHGWYDLIIEVEGSNIRKRYAGRVETGRPSFSDPLMGGMA